MSSNQQQLETLNEYPRVVNIKQDPQTQDTFLKAFLISDKLNQMHWQIPENALKKYINGFIGKPLIQHPTGLHPDYEQEGLFAGSPTYIQDILKHQQQYAIGDIVDVQYEPVKSASGEKTKENAWFAYIKIRSAATNALTSLKSASDSKKDVFVSPQVIDLDASAPGEKTTNFIPTHLAIVNKPAYGAHAKIRGMCNGHLNQCVQELKSAAYVRNDDNSSLLNFSGNENISMPKSNTSDQLQQNAVVNPVPVQQQQQQNQDPNLVNQQQQQTNQQLSEKKQTTELTADGKLVTKTEVAKPQGQNPLVQAPLASLQVPADNNTTQQTITGTDTLNTIPVQQQPPQQPNQPNSNEVAFDWNKLPPEMKQYFDTINKKLEEIDSFKKQEEDNKVKQAAEQQRQQIEQALSVISDDNVRSQLVEFFVSLPLQNDQMTQLLNLLLNGKFGDSNTQGQTQGQPNQAPATPATNKPKIPARPGLKSAAFINTSTSRFTTPREFSDDDFGSSDILFGDIDLGNI